MRHRITYVDLFVIGPVGFGEIVDALMDAQSRLAREINPTVYDLADFQGRLLKKAHFVSALVDQPKLFVIGSEDTLPFGVNIQQNENDITSDDVLSCPTPARFLMDRFIIRLTSY